MPYLDTEFCPLSDVFNTFLQDEASLTPFRVTGKTASGVDYHRWRSAGGVYPPARFGSPVCKASTHIVSAAINSRT